MQDAEDLVFTATLKDIRPLTSLLRSLSFRTRAVVEASQAGLKFTVEEGRSLQANAYIPATCFTSYTFTPLPATPPTLATKSQMNNLMPKFCFEISLNTFIECMNIFGSAGAGFVGAKDEEESRRKEDVTLKRTSMKMNYEEEGKPLVLILEEGGMITRCELATYMPDPLMELIFDDSTRVMKMILKSDWLRDAFSEIDSSAEKIKLIFSPGGLETDFVVQSRSRSYATQLAGSQIPTFRLEATGLFGSITLDYPNDKDVLETFECEDLVQNSYRFSHIDLTSKALIASTKTSIRTDERGFLSFQFMIPLARSRREDKDGFVEFICVPIDD